jgi:hypothetical protein
MCEIVGNALEGLLAPQTLKIAGYINKKNFIVLIDLGSTHKFIYKTLVESLNCFCVSNDKFPSFSF